MANDSALGWQYYFNPWWRERRTYFTRLRVDECRVRLRESTTHWIGAKVRRSRLSLADFTLNRVTFYGNGSKPFAYVRLHEAPIGGTLVQVTIGATQFGRIFFGFWFGFLALWTLGATSASLRQGLASLPVLSFGVGMVAIGLLLNAFGRWLAHGDRDFLIGFLTNVLDLGQPPPSALAVA